MVYNQHSIHYPELNSDCNTLPCLFFPSQNKSLQSCISHRLILAFFEVSELTRNYGCLALLCKGLAVYLISNMQSVKAQVQTAGIRQGRRQADKTSTASITWLSK